MSFILDALRKSEHERQRQAGPAIADLTASRPAERTSPVLGIVGALLAVNLLAVAYFLLREDTAPAGTTTTQAESDRHQEGSDPRLSPSGDRRGSDPSGPLKAAPASIEPPATTPPRELRPLVAEAGGPVRAALPDETPPPAPDPLLLPAATSPAPPQRLPRVSAPADYVPRIDMLPAQATAGLPALNLDLHIYATDPAQRAAFINGRRYRAGDTLPEGAEVLDITPEGALLRYRGQRFILPRP